MKLLISLCLVALASCQTDRTCISARLQAATSRLQTRLGTNLTNIWKDYTVLSGALLNQWAANPGQTTSINNACNALEEFYGMMYGNYFCFDLQNLLNGGATPKDAFSITGTMEEYSFKCSAGFITLLHENMQCVQRVIAGYMNTLNACTSAFLSNVQHNPTSSCDYLLTYEQCWSAPFNTSLCRRSEGADIWWACEGARKFGLNRAPACINSCDLTHGPPRMAEYLEEHHKIENGVMMFKIPDYLDMVDGQVKKVEGQWFSD